MKKIISYCLLILFSFAYSYETIKCFSKVFDAKLVSWIDKFDFEEEDTESGKSNEKNEKLNFSEELFFDYRHICNNLTGVHMNQANHGAQQNIDFSSSDYSQQVYSPPDRL